METVTSTLSMPNLQFTKKMHPAITRKMINMKRKHDIRLTSIQNWMTEARNRLIKQPERKKCLS